MTSVADANGNLTALVYNGDNPEWRGAGRVGEGRAIPGARPMV